ncbi:DUF309 domain-containing protein [Acrocarpospora catenulata]|uniref:DUF309 domain-containing protein n=1 Tax=Acrocarpospora catenulata TaxID=2836182 RepID=UPI001BD94A84|nr:DUF309 domain-containing protein [Acrocarpospora catenulata]
MPDRDPTPGSPVPDHDPTPGSPLAGRDPTPGRRDRDPAGRPRNARPRDAYGRPLPPGSAGVPRIPDDYAPSAQEAIHEADLLLAAGRPFHAHEVFEGRWKCCPTEERDLWQALAQICVGLTHLQRDNPRGATALLTRGRTKLHQYTPRRPYGMDLDAIESGTTIEEIRQALRAG